MRRTTVLCALMFGIWLAGGHARACDVSVGVAVQAAMVEAAIVPIEAAHLAVGGLPLAAAERGALLYAAPAASVAVVGGVYTSPAVVSAQVLAVHPPAARSLVRRAAVGALAAPRAPLVRPLARPPRVVARAVIR